MAEKKNEAVQCSDQGNDVRQDFFRRQNVLTDAVVSENTTLQGPDKPFPVESRQEGISAPTVENSSIVSGDNVSISDEIASSPDSSADLPLPAEEEISLKVIAGVCTSTLEPGREDHIAKCTAGEKMTQCLGTEFGHDVINSTLNMSSQELDRLILEIGQKQRNHPIGYNKAILYLFCHGDAHSVKLADGFVERQYIVKKFQSQFPSEVIKIIIFDCCRLESSPTCVAIEEQNQDTTNSTNLGNLSIHDCSKEDGCYPVSNNMIVIEATDYNRKAFYTENNGCGLFTECFTKLAPTLNVSLAELLVEVRNKVYKQAHSEGEEQCLMYKERLFDTIYLLAESCGIARVPATNVSTTTSLLDAQVTWVIDKKVEKRVKEYCAIITPKEGGSLQPITCHRSHAMFSGLPPNSECSVTVETVYTDGKRVSSEPHHFKTPDVKPAVIKSAKLVDLRRDNEVVYKVEVSQRPESSVKVDKVIIKATTPGGNPVEKAIKNRFAELQLLPGKTYTVLADTYFEGICNKPLRSQDNIVITTPTDEKMKPVLTEENMEQRAANVSITEPPILREKDRFLCQDLQLISIKYALREVPRDGDLTERGQGTPSEFEDFDPPYNSSSETSESASNERKVTKMKPGKRYSMKPGKEYSMKLKAVYKIDDNTRSTIESDEIIFTTKSYRDCQKCGYSCGYLVIYLLLLSGIILAFAGVAAYAAYNIKFDHHEHCNTQNIVTDGRIECGRADSFYYHKIEVTGSREKRNSLLRSINASIVRETDMTFDTKLHKPRMDGGIIIIPLRHLLLGWDIYTWIGSVIYGYCCITNNAATTQTATLHMFINDYDAINFMNGDDANNAILSETVHIPSGIEDCFEDWGSESPFTVTHNAYHYIVVDFPTRTNFTSNITVSQRVVNESNFGPPHSFLYTNSTDFILPTWPIFSHDIYVIVCDAPTTNTRNGTNAAVLEQNITHIQSIPLSVGEESVHILSCNFPYRWKAIVYPIMLALSLLLLVCSTIFCVLMSVCICKCHRDKLCIPCQFQQTQCRHGDGPHYTIQRDE